MNLKNIKTILKQNYIFYLTGFLVIFSLKYFYSNAGSDELTWILTPTTRWVSILSGISFTYISGTGYVNHNLKYIIAPSCCGIQFMIITIAMLIFSFVHRMKRKGVFWTLGSIVLSYPITVFVNGLRIILAVYIPLYLEDLRFYSHILTPDRLHTFIGTVVYFTALLIIYHLADSFSLKISSFPKTAFPPAKAAIAEAGFAKPCMEKAGKSSDCCRQLIRICLPPVFWYLFIVLGIPFLNRAYKSSPHSFAAFALLVSSVCLMIILFLWLLLILLGRLRNQKRLS